MHNTGNPIGSRDILDLYDNSENIDYFTNSQLDEHPDRFGVKRLTLAGLIKRSMALRNEISDFSGAMTFKPEWTDVPMNVSEGVGGEGGALNLQAKALGNRSEINKITSREALRRTYLEVGLNLVEGSFEQGAVLNSVNDILLQETTGLIYYWKGTFPKLVPEKSSPLTTGGIGPTGWELNLGKLLRDLLLDGPIKIINNKFSLKMMIFMENYPETQEGIQTAFNDSYGKVLILGKNKKYQLLQPLLILDNIHLLTNGSTFVQTAGTDFALQINSSNVTIDRLVLETDLDPVTSRGLKGISIIGDDITIGSIKLISTVPGTGAGAGSRVGIKIGPDTGEKNSNINIGSIVTKNWDRSIVFQNLKRSEILNVYSSCYLRAIYIKNCQNFYIKGGNTEITSPNSVGGPGENSILIESTDVTGNCHDIHIENFDSNDSGEHGYRLGGTLSINNVWFTNCSSYKSGSSILINNPAAQEWHGGCGFKILGGTININEPHRNIYFSKCHVYDCNVTPGVFPAGHGDGNYSGFQISVAEQVHMDNCTLKAKNQIYSAGYGVEILASKYVFINNCDIDNTKNRGIRLYDAGETSYPGWDIPSEHIYLNDCLISTYEQAPFSITGSLKNHSNVRMKSCHLKGGLYAIHNELPVVGSHSDHSFEFEYTDSRADPNTATSHIVYGTKDAVLKVTGQWNKLPGFFPQGKDGSIWQDTITGLLRIRWNGAWRQVLTSDALSENSGPASLSSITSVINTVAKFQGKMVFSNGDFKTYRAMGPLPSDPWRSVDGAALITPI